MTIISAPGKALIAGGYLVLNNDYNGLIISTNSKFLTCINDNNSSNILVKSPQFNCSWLYEVTDDGSKPIRQISEGPSNDFIQLALEETFKLTEFVNGIKVNNVDVTILGDNDFYSQRSYLKSRNLLPTYENLVGIKKFNKDLDSIRKTGLGSSAALITSLVTCLLLHFRVICNSFNESDENLIHNLCQYIHCKAQGKVGSGFDVSAAVNGSQIYNRFSPTFIENLINNNETNGEELFNNLNVKFDQKIVKICCPPGVHLLLADIEHGSHTPSLVKSVNKWKSENPVDAQKLYATINHSNQNLIEIFKSLNELYANNKDYYQSALAYLVDSNSNEWKEKSSANNIIDLFNQMSNVLLAIRSSFRFLSQVANVPIEPPEQTKLLDACSEINGIIGGGVPGAGGYDAIYLLAINDNLNDKNSIPKSFKRIQDLWINWTELNVSPLLCTEGFEGIKVESEEEYEKFINNG